MTAMRWTAGWAAWVVLAGGILSAGGLSLRAEELGTFGRVRISAVGQHSAGQARVVQEALEARVVPAPGRVFADQRIVSIRRGPEDPDLWTATIYDYSVERGFDLVLDAQGREVGRQALAAQPALSGGEWADAGTIVRRASIWAAGLARGEQTLYEPMPPLTVAADGRRMINVGVIEQRENIHRPSLNEVVSVHIPTGEIVRYAAGAPDSSRAVLTSCGPSASDCSATVGPCGASYHVEWPAANPVWKFNVTHPACTTSTQSEGTGLQLTEVYLNDVLILERAEMPVLNVQYAGDVCGPFRDWLSEEDCFQATGVDAAPGIRVTTGNPAPSTFCESGTDSGNFRGIAIHDEGTALYLLTETNAGWYRYVNEWRLYLDGTIEPVMGFGATNNSCTCHLHDHHAYWRFEWAIGGTSGDVNTGIATIERRRPGTADVYDPVTTEGKFYRPSAAPETDWWRILNPQSGTGFILRPSPTDGSAVGDSYAKGDLWALADHAGQMDDPNTDTSINIDPWISGETLGTTKRLVTWYHVTFHHDVAGGDTEACDLTGPRFVPFSECAGIDCQAPGLFNVQASSISTGGATVSWATDEPSTSTIQYGTAPSAGVTASSAAFVTSHSMVLAGLASCTTYYYWVGSTDAAGNTTETNAGGGSFAFKTSGNGCATAIPPEVPDGSPGSAVRASRETLGGSTLHVQWDAGTCSSPNYHLIYGSLATASTYALGGGVCGLGPGGSYMWNGVPPGNLWFLVVGDDVVQTEGSWGKNSQGVERKGTSASAQCGFTARANTGVCL